MMAASGEFSLAQPIWKRIEANVANDRFVMQERLRHWEARERKKQREYEKLEQKEKERMEEQQKHALWLKQFLEDYDDERDDQKYYKYEQLLFASLNSTVQFLFLLLLGDEKWSVGALNVKEKWNQMPGIVKRKKKNLKNSKTRFSPKATPIPMPHSNRLLVLSYSLLLFSIVV